jgi:hypothetical protein
MSRRNPSTPAVEGETPVEDTAVVDDTSVEGTVEETPVEVADPTPGVADVADTSEPDFSSQLFVPVEEAIAQKQKIVELEALVASLRTAASVVEEQRTVEKAVVTANDQRMEADRLRMSEENADLHVQLSGAVNDAAFANAQVKLYHKQVAQWREALKSLAPLVAFVEGKGSLVKDEGVVMRMGDAYITFKDIRSWAGVFKT